MTTFREKYSYAVDRRAGGFWYRFQSEFEIRRSAVGPANFLPWHEFNNPGDTRRTWRKICDAAAQCSVCAAPSGHKADACATCGWLKLIEKETN